MRCFDDAVSFLFRQILNPLILFVDFNFGNVTAIAQQVADRTGRPDRLAMGRRNVLSFKPVPHGMIRTGIDISLKELLNPCRMS